jgi:DNA-binding MarR family transcriptional regulator
MEAIETDLEQLEDAMRLFFQTMKRPQNWAQITASAGVSIDRPAMFILHALALANDQRCRVQDLATQLGIEAPSVTRKTQELEQAGYIRRMPDPKDRRAIGLELTAKGQAIHTKIRKAQKDLIVNAFNVWSKADRQQFVTLFERFSNDLAQSQLVTNK